MTEYCANPRPGRVYLLDVDNTLFDNDQFAVDLRGRLSRDFGETETARYWEIYAQVREQLGYADYLLAVQRFRSGLEEHPALLGLSQYLLDYPFAERLFPGALRVLTHLQLSAPTVILSDGDVVFQPRKIQRSGIWSAVSGRVLIHVHKERMLDSMQRRYPAKHYVMVDDKVEILAAMKRIMGSRLTSIFVRQGHYARSTAQVEPAPDRSIQCIGELLMTDINTP